MGESPTSARATTTKPTRIGKTVRPTPTTTVDHGFLLKRREARIGFSTRTCETAAKPNETATAIAVTRPLADPPFQRRSRSTATPMAGQCQRYQA